MFFSFTYMLLRGCFSEEQNNPRGHVYASKSSEFILVKAENYSTHEEVLMSQPRSFPITHLESSESQEPRLWRSEQIPWRWLTDSLRQRIFPLAPLFFNCHLPERYLPHNRARGAPRSLLRQYLQPPRPLEQPRYYHWWGFASSRTLWGWFARVI